MTNKQKKELLKDISSKLLEFFLQYQKSLWLKNKDGTLQYQKDAGIVPIITKTDLLYYLNINLTLKEFDELLELDNKLKSKLNDFINNNYVHYCSSVKLKELMQEYKDSTVIFEPNNFVIDYSKMNIFGSFSKIYEKQSLGVNDEQSEIDDKERAEILKDVELFN